MKILTLEEYINFYNRRGYCVDSVGVPKNKLNYNQLCYKHERYVKKEERKLNKTKIKKQNININKFDEKWDETKKKAFELNPNAEEFWNSLNMTEYEVMKKRCKGTFGILDPCHIFGKGSHPHMKYLIENIVIAPRYFHSLIDQYINPFTGENISEDERNSIWIKIIGKECFQELLDYSRGL